MQRTPGLVTALNAIREAVIEGDQLHHQYIPVIDDNTSITEYGAAVTTYKSTQNAWVDQLMNRIVYTQVITKNFNNPLRQLQGEAIPLGYSGQEIYTNPATARKFNDNDFIGLLQKYDADVKVQYVQVNSELQYPVTISRARLKQAFVSWDSLESFITSITNSLYQGAYIDQYNSTKGLVSSAYSSNQVKVQQVAPLNSEANAKAFITAVRGAYFAFQQPSLNYNAWNQAGGYGKPVTTWVQPEDIVFIIRGDAMAYLDVNVMAAAFNIDKADLLGRIIVVDNFDVINRETGVKVFDGSNIIGIMADRNWFRIKEQTMEMDEFYNANNRSWQYYLATFMMYQYSLFANALVFATVLPEVDVTELSFNNVSGITLAAGTSKTVDLEVTPAPATAVINFTMSGSGVTTESLNNGRKVTLTAAADAAAGSQTLTAKSGDVEATLTVNVTAAAAQELNDEPIDESGDE